MLSSVDMRCLSKHVNICSRGHVGLPTIQKDSAEKNGVILLRVRLTGEWSAVPAIQMHQRKYLL